jgi:hypothetical protein
MDRFPNAFNLSKLNHKEIENVQRLIISNEIDLVIRCLPMKKYPRYNGFQIFKELMLMISKYSQNL